MTWIMNQSFFMASKSLVKFPKVVSNEPTHCK